MNPYLARKEREEMKPLLATLEKVQAEVRKETDAEKVTPITPVSHDTLNSEAENKESIKLIDAEEHPLLISTGLLLAECLISQTGVTAG